MGELAVVVVGAGPAGSRPRSRSRTGVCSPWCSTRPTRSVRRGAADTTGCGSTPVARSRICRAGDSRRARRFSPPGRHRRSPRTSCARGGMDLGSARRRSASTGRRRWASAPRTGTDGAPRSWSRRDTSMTIHPGLAGPREFEGELIHSRDYRNAAPYAGKRVLVVGPGCTGMEIAYDLAEGGAEKVWLAVRTPPNIVMREGPGGCRGLHRHRAAALAGAVRRRFGERREPDGRRRPLRDGLPVPDEGVFSRQKRLGVAPRSSTSR